jgi:hypothetical protein
MSDMRCPHLLVLAACVVATSCVKREATECGDYICPVGLACASDHCVDSTLVTSCAGHAESDPCELGAGGSGLCQGGICIVGRCGDGTINGIEECDGGNLGGKSCLDFGASAPEGLSCSSTCSFDMTGCTAYCGNNHVDGTEQCDGTDLGQKSCTDYGFYGGTLSCANNCMANLGQCAGRCGNGVIEALEPCDGANLNGKTCASLGYLGTVLPLACTADCAFAASSCTCGGVLCPSNQQCVVNAGIASCQ